MIYCSCVKTVREEGIRIPYGTNVDDLQPNTTPHVGVLALFTFPATKEYPEGVPHVALVDDIGEKGFYIVQGNKTPCERTTEWLPWDYESLRGFWKEQTLEVAVSEKIIKYAEEHGADVELALNVACAESCTTNKKGNVVFNPNARNPNSTAAGVFQFIKGTWDSLCEGDVLDADDNIDCATRIIANGGINHWEASKNDGFGGGWANEPYLAYIVAN